MPRRMAYDRWLFVTTLLIVVAGLIMVGSSSNYAAMLSGSASTFYLKQALHVALGFLALYVTMRVRYQLLADRTLLGVGFCGFLVLLGVTLFMPDAGGAARWIRVGPLGLQPSEFAKLFAVLFVAATVARREERIGELRAVLVPTLVVLGPLVALIAIEDLGSATIVAAIGALLLFVAGLPWRFVFAGAAAGSALFAVGVLVEGYRMRRILAFLDPSSDPSGASYQLFQSLIAFGNGGTFGVGLGGGQQKAHFIFGSHTDFIFSTIGEELGLIGTLAFLAAFMVIFWRGVRAALGAPDRFGFYLALGTTSLIVLQALINMGVAIGLLPTKGLALPFVSYGGSSLLASMAAMGLLLNVSQHSN